MQWNTLPMIELKVSEQKNQVNTGITGIAGIHKQLFKVKKDCITTSVMSLFRVPQIEVAQEVGCS